jgi:hypothetical protein
MAKTNKENNVTMVLSDVLRRVLYNIVSPVGFGHGIV